MTPSVCSVSGLDSETALYCRTCGLACRPVCAGTCETVVCPRCGERMVYRIPSSLSKTGSYLIAATIFYIPANLLPMTHVTTLGQLQSDTIMSGIAYFLQTGLWFVAGVIFVASIVVPLTKLIILTGLLISIRRKSGWRPVERTRLYRFVQMIGRWSMVDVFVITIMIALVQAGGLASVETGSGAVYFLLVVILTMLASRSFDPRLIWDAAEEAVHDR